MPMQLQHCSELFYFQNFKKKKKLRTIGMYHSTCPKHTAKHVWTTQAQFSCYIQSLLNEDYMNFSFSYLIPCYLFFYQVLAGHEGPISSLSFNPVKCVLASGSWDKTVKLWDMLDSWRTKETLMLNSDGNFYFYLISNIKILS